MSRYLARLKAINAENPLPKQPSKPSKAPYDGFDGEVGDPFSANPAPIFDVAARQREADARNRGAQSSHLTDRFCICGSLATIEDPQDGRPVWRCLECLPSHRMPRS